MSENGKQPSAVNANDYATAPSTLSMLNQKRHTRASIQMNPPVASSSAPGVSEHYEHPTQQPLSRKKGAKLFPQSSKLGNAAAVTGIRSGYGEDPLHTSEQQLPDASVPGYMMGLRRAAQQSQSKSSLHRQKEQ